MGVIFSIAALCLLLIQPAHAATKTWTDGGGDHLWSTPGNWSPSGVPGSGDDVVFDSTSTDNATIDATFAGTISTLSINSGYSGTITVSRSFTINNSFTQGAGTFTGGSQNITIGTNFSLSSGTFNATSGTFNVGASYTISGGTYVGTGTTTNFNSGNSANITCTGTLTTITGASFTVNKGFMTPFTVKSGCSLTATVTDGSFAQNGSITIESGASLTSVGDFYASTLTNNGSYTSGTGAFNVGANGNCGGFSANGTTNNLSAATTFDVEECDVTLGSGKTLTVGASTITIAGSFVDNGGTFDMTGKTLDFTGSRATTVSCSGNFNTIYSPTLVKVDKGFTHAFTLSAGCTLTAQIADLGNSQNGNITVNGSLTSTAAIVAYALTVNSGGSFTAGATSTTATIGGNGNCGGLNVNDTTNMTNVSSSLTLDNCSITVATGKTLTVGATSITLGGSIVNNGTFDLTGKTLLFNNSATSTINCSGDYNSLTGVSSITVDKGFGADQFAVGAGCTVTAQIRDFSFAQNGYINVSGTLHATGDFYAYQVNIASGGKIDLVTGNLTVGANGNTGGTSVTGTLDLTNATTSSFQYGALTVNVGGVITVGPTLTVQGNYTNHGTVNLTGKTLSLTGTDLNSTLTTDETIEGNLTINKSGKTVTLAQATTISGNLTVTAGTLDASASNYNINLAGNWSNSGTFTARSGTVVMNGTNQTMSGATTFFNFTKTTSTLVTLTMQSSVKFTFTGTLDLEGIAGHRIALRASTPGVQTQIDAQGTRTLQYLNVEDNDNTNVTAMSCSTGCFDAGNNFNWTIPGGAVGDGTATITESGGETDVTEGGATDSYTVVLDTAPTATVTVTITTDTSQVTADHSTLTFTTGNYSTPQLVTVTAVNDSIASGTRTSTITHSVSSSDTNYNGVSVASVTAHITDNDTAGFTVSAASGDTTEAGGTATFTVVLTSQPTADVTTAITSGDTTEGTPSPSSLTFTSGNWSTPQTVTVTGVDDQIDDGNIFYTIVTGAATSGDSNYNGLNPADVNLFNDDNDTGGITVSAISGDTTEAGGTATFTIVLNTQPVAGVTIGLTSSDLTEGTVSPSSVSFTTVNWSTPQTVTVTGVDDVSVDGNVTYTIVTAAASSSDGVYNGMNPADVTVVNDDNDAYGVTVSLISGHTTEAGTTATFTAVLNTQPASDVTFSITSSDLTEGTVSASSLTFTNGNWDTPQTVTVTGVDDNIVDGNISYTITTGLTSSADTNYNNLNPDNVTVVNDDNDIAGVTLGTISGDTTEAGGTATFTAVLTAQPTADVTFGLSSSDTTEGTIAVSLLTFTNGNWNTPQTVTVTGVDDVIVDGDVSYSIITGSITSGDTAFSGINPDDVTVVNDDNDSAGVTIGAISGHTTEAGATATFTAVLTSRPSADVSFTLTSSNTAEGTVSPASLTFTNANWSTPQTVTVTGVDDAVIDGSITYTIITSDTTSADGLFNGIVVADVTVVNDDNDTPNATLGSISGHTTEAGGTATFTVTLTSQPTDDVTFSLSSSDTTEGTVSPSSLTFTNGNWDTPQTVTVTGVDDNYDDGDITYSIVTGSMSSVDSNFNGVDPADETVVNNDDDTGSITVSAISGDTTEAGGTATFTVVLTAQPTANVFIPISSSDTTEGTVPFPQITFTTGNWNTPQTITMTGVDDPVVDGNVTYAVVFDFSSSADLAFEGLKPSDVTVVNDDNDSIGVTFGTVSAHTTESGGTATFTMALSSQPADDVVIPLSSSDTTEGTVDPSSVTFTSANWDTPQTVTVTGVDDAIADGQVTYSIVTGAATSGDTNYSGFNASDVSVVNDDNDSAGITVSAISGHTTEAGGTATFTIVLTAQPTSDVTIGLSSSDTTEGLVSPASLTFTSVNWSTPQTVTVTGVDDAEVDGNITYTIVTAAAVASDGNYSGFDASDVTVVNDDNDTATPPGGGGSTGGGGGGFFPLPPVKVPSQVTVVEPKGGETWLTGSLATINWTTTDDIRFVNISLSFDNGLTFASIATGVPNTGSFSFMVPVVESSVVIVRIDGRDFATNLASDTTERALTMWDGPITDTADPLKSSANLTGPSPVNGELQTLTPVAEGWYIKSPTFPTVYRVDSLFIRHPFLNASTYFTYANSFSEIHEVSDATLATLTLGGPMLPKGGVALVKIQSVPNVYAVEDDGELRWIPSEETAATVFGSNWADYVIDVDPTFFGYFHQGPDISDADIVDRTLLKTRQELSP